VLKGKGKRRVSKVDLEAGTGLTCEQKEKRRHLHKVSQFVSWNPFHRCWCPTAPQGLEGFFTGITPLRALFHHRHGRSE